MDLIANVRVCRIFDAIRCRPLHLEAGWAMVDSFDSGRARHVGEWVVVVAHLFIVLVKFLPSFSFLPMLSDSLCHVE